MWERSNLQKDRRREQQTRFLFSVLFFLYGLKIWFSVTQGKRERPVGRADRHTYVKYFLCLFTSSLLIKISPPRPPSPSVFKNGIRVFIFPRCRELLPYTYPTLSTFSFKLWLSIQVTAAFRRAIRALSPAPARNSIFLTA